jgi:hypothetical protein
MQKQQRKNLLNGKMGISMLTVNQASVLQNTAVQT